MATSTSDYSINLQEGRSSRTNEDGSFASSSQTARNGPYSPVDSPNPPTDALTAASTRDNIAALTSGQYHPIMSFMYPSFEPSNGFSSQQFVNPTQLVGQDSSQPLTYTSPSSDGWGGNGFNSSTTASPEPLAHSNSSTPPSTENGSTHGSTSQTVRNRKVSGPGRASQDSAGPSTSKKKMSGGGAGAPSGSRLSGSRSPTSTPDLATTDAGNRSNTGDDDSIPTVCTNCQTTNTPLWRRDPEGQPLCECI